ncbi:MAG: sugar phosphate isomerase/epimerase [Clostridia bacterium]|nr:sugar phosphate isomerase/epimerase [Clostridia bacterium]
MSRFKFSAGPWNVHEGADAFGPEVRNTIPLEQKIKRFKEIGLDAVQFHDDDAVPEINHLTEEGIKNKAAEVKEMLDQNGLVAEFVAPRLWMDPHTIDGGFTSNSKQDREFALWRALRSIDIANVLGCDKVVLWLAREGTLCYESKDPVEGVNRIAKAISKMLEYDENIKVLIETKPNEPIDRSFCPTIGHVMGLAYKTIDPDRVGGLLETAHAMLAGLDPANEMAFALAFGKLWGVHLNDQNGIKYDQDKAFGVENLRTAFNQIKVLVDNDYGSRGEYIGLDVKAMRTQKDEVCYRHLENSLKIVKILEKKVDKLDKNLQQRCIQQRDYEALEMYIIELLTNG